MPDPEKVIRAQQSHAIRSVVAEHADLMPQGNDVEFQRGTAVQAEGERGEDGGEHRDPAHNATGPAVKSPRALGISES